MVHVLQMGMLPLVHVMLVILELLVKQISTNVIQTLV